MPDNKIKILLVDSDENMRIFFRDVFWIHRLTDRCDLEMADNLENARKAIGNLEVKPHYIFMDVVMAGNVKGENVTSSKIGLEFLKEIKENPELSGTKVIVFSFNIKKDVLDKVKKLGIEEYIEKQNNLPRDIVDKFEKIYAKYDLNR